MRPIVAAILFLLAAQVHGQSCPAKPDSDQFYMTGPDFYNGQNCPPGQSFTFTLTKRTACYPWYIPCPGYTIQPCDDVEWSFGDGTSEQTKGVASATHTWSSPGWYQVRAKVTNANGSATVDAPILVAMQPPAYVSFAQESFTARENAGVANVVLNRAGDLSRSVTVQYRNGWTTGIVDRNMEIVEGSLTFAPGESTKTLALRVVDDQTYNGDQGHWLYITNETGSAILKESIRDTTTIRIVEDDSPPRASMPSSQIRVTEGDRGQDAIVRIPITLSQAFTQALTFDWLLWDGTAKRESDYRSTGALALSGSVIVPAGQTSAELTVAIVGDDQAEADESFTISLIRSNGPALVIEGSPATITIADDDIGLIPDALFLLVGESVEIAVDVGSANGGKTISVTSSDDSVARVSPEVTVPVGLPRGSVRVEARQPGTATIRATLEGGAKSATAFVQVHQPAEIRFGSLPDQIAEGAAASFTLGVSFAALPIDVTLSTTGTGAVEIPNRVTVGAGGSATVPLRGVRKGTVTITALIPQSYGPVSTSRTIEVRPAAVKRRSTK